MPLPPRAFWSAFETAARLQCSPTHLLGLAYQGHFAIRVSVGFAKLQTGDCVAGLYRVAPEDLFPMTDHCAAHTHHVRRLITDASDRPESAFIEDPAEGIPVTLSSLLILDAELAAFEADHNVNGARYVTPPVTEARYPWDEFFAAVVRRIHDEGVPDTQNKLAAEMQQWFIDRDPDGRAPDLRTITKRLSPIWRALREETS